MPKSEKKSGIAPLPHYVMADGSIPPYEQILGQVQEYDNFLIGTSYYYIHATETECHLCRIIHGGGKIFFHTLVDHEKHGISEDDIMEAVRIGTGMFSIPDYYPISPHIEQKLRILYEE
jgi:hypothetical protein